MKKTLILLSLILTSTISFAGEFKNLIALEAGIVSMTVSAVIEKVARSECPECKGTGKIKAGDGQTIVWRECDNCYDDGKGSGDSGQSNGEQPVQALPDKPQTYEDGAVVDPAIIADLEPGDGKWFDPIEENTVEDENPLVLPSAEKRKRILFFTAEWCGPCRQVKAKNGPLDKLKSTGWLIGHENSNHIQVIDYDANTALARQYRVTQLPTFILIDGDSEIKRQSGYMDQWALGKMFETSAPKKVESQSQKRMSAAQLRAWARSYTGERYYVKGMTMTQHLTTGADEHEGGSFEAWQLRGLNATELEKIHGGQHTGVLTPFGAVQ